MHAVREHRIDEPGRVARQAIVAAGKGGGEIGIVAPGPHLAFALAAGDLLAGAGGELQRLGEVRLQRARRLPPLLVDVAVDHHADAQRSVMKRDRPCPARAVGERFHGEGAGLFDVVFVAVGLRPAEVAADGDVGEGRLFLPLAEVLRRQEPRLSGRVDHVVEADRFAAAVPALDGRGDRTAVGDLHRCHSGLFADLGARHPRMVEQDRVELGTDHLIGMRVAAELPEIHAAGRLGLLHPEEAAVLLDEAVRVDPLAHAREIEDRHHGGDQRFADVVARELFALAHHHVEALARHQGRGHRSGRAAASHQNAGVSTHRRRAPVWSSLTVPESLTRCGAWR